MICESCLQDEATCHYTVIGEGGKMKSQHLCADCYRTDLRDPQELRAATPGTRCHYCGEQACVGGVDLFALATGEAEYKYLCAQCLSEYSRYVEQQLEGDFSGLSRKEQIVLIRKVNDRTDKHMKQWCSKGAGL
jgi:protein-arginine kinase activator protein McsA